jgi:diguanylate cyclase (GGDEF)-like protein
MDKKSSVIIIDDDIRLLQVIKTGLLSKDFRCEAATSVESAFELINKTSFDIMLVDIAMPGMESFALTEKAKKLSPDMLVIIMTGYIEDFSFDRAIEAGVSDFIKKPFSLHELTIRIKLVKLHEKLLSMSVTDELTGLYNRRGFFTLAEQQLNIYNRLKEEIYLLYADLDNLKVINDTRGHPEGDHAIIETAKIFRDSFRKSDIIARIGGDEFVAIPFGMTRNGVKITTSRLQKNLEIYNAKRYGSYDLSISVGMACYNPESPCSIDELLSQADKSMYEQKRQLKRC